MVMAYNVFVELHAFANIWGRDKMVTISQTTVSNAFSWLKMYDFW